MENATESGKPGSEQTMDMEPLDVDKLLAAWGGRSADRERINFGASHYYRAWNFRIGIPLVVFSALAASKVFKIGENSSNIWISLVTNLVTIGIPILAGLQTFLRFGELAEKHRVMAAKYGALKREVQQILALPLDQRGDPHKLLDTIRTRYDALELEEPQIPRSLWETVTARAKSLTAS